MDTQALAADAAKLEAITGTEQTINYQMDITLGVMMTAVDSSNLSAIGWHKAFGLIVEFKNGGLYTYPSLPTETLDAILSADSKGKAFHAEVKAKDVPFVKLQ